MSSFLLKLLKPKGKYAKWLIFFVLILTLGLGASGKFEGVRAYLDTELLTFKVGTYTMSVYGLIRALLIVVIIFWSTAIVSDMAEMRIGNMKKMRAANRALLLKLVQILIYVIAFLIALDVVGIDLTTLTVFSGALGIGLGFGLQKIASNFISGLILLFEKSVEQDDLIELSDGTFGFVRKTHARCILVETFDGKEILIPNEDLITSRVINWTLSNNRGRVEIKFGVSYGSDIKKARELVLEAAKEHPRCIAEPEPQCYLRNFGDSSVDFILHFWVQNIEDGRWVPHSEVMFAIWDKFKDNDIQIPFPQRDVHVKAEDMQTSSFPPSGTVKKSSVKKKSAKKSTAKKVKANG